MRVVRSGLLKSSAAGPFPESIQPGANSSPGQIRRVAVPGTSLMGPDQPTSGANDASRGAIPRDGAIPSLGRHLAGMRPKGCDGRRVRIRQKRASPRALPQHLEAASNSWRSPEPPLQLYKPPRPPKRRRLCAFEPSCFQPGLGSRRHDNVSRAKALPLPKGEETTQKRRPSRPPLFESV